MGKLDIYLGKGAAERGVFVYPDISFCEDPSVICSHPKTNELRWVLGLLEWSDRIQSYVHPTSGWNYMDELKAFVDGGMEDGSFVNAVINIVTRNCHDNTCPDRWVLDKENNVFEANRMEHFRKIIFEVFNLPMTYHPTISPIRTPTWSPTFSPTASAQPTIKITPMPTSKPTRRKKGNGQNGGNLKALPPNSAQSSKVCMWLIVSSIVLSTAILFG